MAVIPLATMKSDADDDLQQRQNQGKECVQQEKNSCEVALRTLDSLKPTEVCIDGCVYDISNFDHPGGDTIELFGGNDVTITYKMIHANSYYRSPEKRLAKMQFVGKIRDYPQPEFRFGSDFEMELKREVYKIVPIGQEYGTPGWWFRALLCLTLNSYAMYLWSTTTKTNYSLAMTYGLTQAFLGFNTQHDANHGAASKKPWVNHLMGYCVDFLGMSKWIWLEEHWWHHHYTNDAQRDPDSSYVQPAVIFNDYPLGHPARRWYHRFQILFYLPITAGALFQRVFHPETLTLKSPAAMACGMKLESQYITRSVPYAMTLRVLYVYFNLLCPLINQGLKVEVVANLVLMGVVMTVTFAAIFTLSHNFEISDRDPTQQYRKTGESVCWFKAQVESSSSYGGWISGALTGGLNFQIEHHLFPRMSSAWYPYIAPTVRRVCEKHGVRYVHFPWIWQNLFSTMKYMHQVGSGPLPWGKDKKD